MPSLQPKPSVQSQRRCGSRGRWPGLALHSARFQPGRDGGGSAGTFRFPREACALAVCFAESRDVSMSLELSSEAFRFARSHLWGRISST